MNEVTCERCKQQSEIMREALRKLAIVGEDNSLAISGIQENFNLYNKKELVNFLIQDVELARNAFDKIKRMEK